MRAVRYKSGGQLVWWDAPDPDNEVDFDSIPVRDEEIPEGAELIYLNATPEEFERQLQADCGQNEIGQPYLNDDVDSTTDITRQHDKPGRRVGHKRVRAYAPANPVTKLQNELGRNPNQSVSWRDLQAIIDRFIS